MAEKWWRRLFGMDHADDDLRRDMDELGESIPRSAVGRFKDERRHIEVRMISQYPGNGQESVHDPAAHVTNGGHPFSTGKSNGTEELSLQDGTLRTDKKPSFHLSRVPSPVFGYRKPPQDFYRNVQKENYYLDPRKEEREKKQIDEIKAEDLQKRRALLPQRKDQPVVEPTIISRPSLERRTEEPDTDKVHRSEDRNDAPGNQQPHRHEAHVRNDPIIETGNKLPHSPHRPGLQSKVPFNVLMFRSDRPAESRAYGCENSRKETTDSQPEKAGLQLPLELLDDPPAAWKSSDTWIAEKKRILGETLSNFHVSADIIGYVQGPSVTRFDLRLQPGVKINKVLGLAEDIKLSLAVKQVRIAVVPGKGAVGIEIPNEYRRPVVLKQILDSGAFRNSTAPLTAALGQDVSGNRIVTNLAKMPHGLIAGATGSGKSVCIHSLILSLIYRNTPDRLRFLLIDPKVVELAPYQKIPHLAAPVITEPKEAAAALKWAVGEMEQRYHAFADAGVRDIDGYNRKISETVGRGKRLPYMVIIIDELADLMMISPQDVEESVCRIAQKARAAGIHLLLATQRPSVDVITGLIKSNIPARIAFSVSSQTDSRTILDCGGAERLLGRGDMLYAENGARTLKRIQGCFVSDEEINRVTDAFENRPKEPYLFSMNALRSSAITEDEDDLLGDAAAFVVEQGQASVSSIQRHFRIGYNRAARLVDELESRNMISGANGSKPRQVLISKERLDGELSDRRHDEM